MRDDTDRRRVLIEAVPKAREQMLARYGRLDTQTRATLASFTAAVVVIARFIEASLHDTQSLLDRTS